MNNKSKEEMNKHLREFKDNTNKWLNEIKKIMQNMKEEFNNDIEILKKNKLKFGNKNFNNSN
jgi:Sec-independent protein translocase protein TatA